MADIAAHEATACAIFEQYPDVDAIVGSDVVASVALQEASRRGIEVPADLQVIAYDGTLMAETAGKRLTAIRQDFPGHRRRARRPHGLTDRRRRWPRLSVQER